MDLIAVAGARHAADVHRRRGRPDPERRSLTGSGPSAPSHATNAAPPGPRFIFRSSTPLVRLRAELAARAAPAVEACLILRSKGSDRRPWTHAVTNTGADFESSTKRITAQDRCAAPPPPSTWMTRISPSSLGGGAASRKGRACAPTASTMRSVVRWLGDHSQKCANVVRALANASCAHNRFTDTTVAKLKPLPRPSARPNGRSQVARRHPTRRPTGYMRRRHVVHLAADDARPSTTKNSCVIAGHSSLLVPSDSPAWSSRSR